MVKVTAKKTISPYAVFTFFNSIFLIILALLCILPIIHVLAVSFSGSGPAAANQVVFWPLKFTTQSYRMIGTKADFLTSFLVSIERTVIGVTINTALSILMAYPLSKSDHEFKGRSVFVWSLIFVMVFNAGIVPLYLVVNQFHLINSIWALILPGAVQVFNIILLMNFIKQMPKEIEEAAFIDGASYFKSLIRIVVPLSKPAIATIVLFSFLGQWNAWFDGLIFMNDTHLYPLQTFMYSVLQNASVTSLDQAVSNADVNSSTLKSAELFISMLPILIIYPFMQKYFTKGLVLGAVKG